MCASRISRMKSGVGDSIFEPQGSLRRPLARSTHRVRPWRPYPIYPDRLPQTPGLPSRLPLFRDHSRPSRITGVVGWGVGLEAETPQARHYDRRTYGTAGVPGDPLGRGRTRRRRVCSGRGLRSRGP